MANEPTFLYPVDPTKWRVSQSVQTGHIAIDWAAPMRTPCTASLAGTVVYAKWSTAGYGNLVVVQNGVWKTYLGHLDSFAVTVGQVVGGRVVVGLTGTTGNSTGPHLHYEIRKNNRCVDPRPLLSAWQPPDDNKDDITPPPPDTADDWKQDLAQLVTVTADAGLRVRQGPSTAAPTLWIAPEGTRFERDGEPDGKWQPVRVYLHTDWIGR